MVEVRRRQSPAPALPQRTQKIEQRDGIEPAREGDGDRRTLREQTARPQVVIEPLRQARGAPAAGPSDTFVTHITKDTRRRASV